MKKVMSLLFALALLLSLGSTVTALGEEPAPPAPEKPVAVTVLDEAGKPVSGVSVEVLDDSGKVVATLISSAQAESVFLPEGQYTLRIASVPDGYLPGESETPVVIARERGEQVKDYPGETHNDHSHTNVCSDHQHPGVETYGIKDGDRSVPVFSFNQNDAKPGADSHYQRQMGSPEFLYSLAQNKADDITARQLYDHVLAILYHSKDVQTKYGLDDDLARYLTNMAIRSFTDAKCFPAYDDAGNSLALKDEEGNPVRDEKGNDVYGPGGTPLGYLVNHAREDNNSDSFPQAYRDAYRELIGYTDHPEDYYLYIYCPANYKPGAPDAYQCLLAGLQMTPVRASLSVRAAAAVEITKKWEDAENQDGLRPAAEDYASSVRLLANREDVTADYRDNLSITDNGDQTYTVRFVNLPATDDGGNEISYTFREEDVPGYTADSTIAVPGATITNTHQPETTTIKVTKVWDDANDADKLRPESITVHLLADGTEVSHATLNKEGDWAWSFPDLPVYRDGKKIEYTVSEDPVDGYETKVEGFTVTNTHEVDTIEITVEKVWDDDDNRDGIRPKSVTVHLLADGVEVQTVKVTEEDEWIYVFKDLPEFKGDDEIIYTVTEDPVEDYETTIEGFTITNKHEPERISIPVQKVWSDGNNKAKKRPASITITLKANGKDLETVKITPDEKGKWNHIFEDVYKYENGKEIEYSVTEEAVQGYYTSITPRKNGFLIRNSTTPITGDSSRSGLWTALLLASVLGLSGLGVFAWRRWRRHG